ncbi:hypothetical protein [Brevibacillus laterosporus]|uniref:hypothetical protein n=1 Tax=Brevibacillus laterosporus TaxID=1465 RepID=UPI0018F88F07|nr:hypothetical protein [Brevibacillus laterosporus]MBG9776170.1 hypothetical protein [Brevibacillus laterosporus]
MDVSKTYFGFTVKMKPMQKRKTENVLDALVRDNGKVIPEKVWIYQKLVEGYTPEIEKDFSYWSSKTKEMTKPKDEYRLVKNGFYNTINKTLYLYAKYIIENGLTDSEKATKYINDEQMKIEQFKAEQERIFVEEKARQEQKRQLEEQERQAKKEEKEKALHDTIHALTSDELNKIKNITDYILKEYVNLLNSVTIEEVENWVKNSIANSKLYPESAIANIKYYKELIADQCPNSTNANYIKRSKMLQDVRELFFGITLDMSPQTTRKILSGKLTGEEATNRIQKAEQARQHQLDKLVTFYRFIAGQGFTQAQGERIIIEGITVYGMEYKGNFILIEESSGAQLTKGKNKTEAKKNAKKVILHHGIEKVKNIIAQQVNKNGLSPLLQQHAI